jgi:hypothetical protein
MLEASSAAALILAMGTVGMRTVQPYTHVQFHNSRATMQVEHPMTAIHAIAAAGELQRLDTQAVDTVVAHLAKARGGLRGLAIAGLNRCQSLQKEAATVEYELAGEASAPSKTAQKGKAHKNKNGWFKSTVISYENTLKGDKAQAYTNLLASIFALDQKMPSEMAWCLQLIDAVEGSSVLKPEAESKLGPQDDAPKSPAMRLAA